MEEKEQNPIMTSDMKLLSIKTLLKIIEVQQDTINMLLKKVWLVKIAAKTYALIILQEVHSQMEVNFVSVEIVVCF